MYTKERDAKSKQVKADAAAKLLKWQAEPACGKWMGWGPESLPGEASTLQLVGKSANLGERAHVKISLQHRPKSWKQKQAAVQPSWQCGQVKGCKWEATHSPADACLAQAATWHTRCGNGDGSATIARYQATGAMAIEPEAAA